MWPYFTYNNISYILRRGPIYLPSMHLTYYGTNSIHFRGPWFGIIFLGILNLANHLNLKLKLRTLEILIVDVSYVIRLIYTLNLQKCHYQNNYFPFCYKTYPNGSFMFYFHHGLCSNNYFEYDTFYNSFIVFCWNLVDLDVIYTYR